MLECNEDNRTRIHANLANLKRIYIPTSRNRISTQLSPHVQILLDPDNHRDGQNPFLNLFLFI